MNDKAIHATVHGKVQGVFFRKETSVTASRLGLTGWVRNTPDGAVEVWAEGNGAKIEKFAKWLESGPPMALVSRIELKYTEPTCDHFTFSIRN